MKATAFLLASLLSASLMANETPPAADKPVRVVKVVKNGLAVSRELPQQALSLPSIPDVAYLKSVEQARQHKKPLVTYCAKREVSDEK